MKKVTIYSTPTCHYCHMAKEYFDQNGIKYEDFDVAADIEKRREMVEKTGQMGVPVIMIGNEAVIGFDQAMISQLLGV